MHKLPSLFALFWLLLSSGSTVLAKSIPGNLFHDDLSCIESEMSSLTALENHIQTKHLTLSQMLEAGDPLSKVVQPEGDLSQSVFGSSAPDHERLMDIPGFLWGFCCSFVGAFLVYLSIDDPEARKKEGTQAIIGCAIGTLIWAGLYVWMAFALSYY